MPLPAGTRVGSYEVLGSLGSGGMGEVYKARDIKLNREVAIKALPEAFAQDSERVARFEREAQLLASLNHPHIAAIYGLEEAEGAKFLILELVQGHSLAERLATGPMTVTEAIAIARQIVDALESAHGRGIIHRDLKPGNIMVTPDGQVKVLDFGLAKALDSDRGTSAANSPTLTFAATQAGVILGTATYMSPEQARGRAADKRSDVWAFGCVLYEMVTGTRPFGGDDVTDTIAAVVRSEPDWNTLPRDLPAMVRIYLRRCLQKQPKDRIQDIGDMRLALEGAFDVPEAPQTAASTKASISTWRLMAAGIALLAIGGVLSWILKPAPASTPQSVRRFGISAAPQILTIANTNHDLVLTPDGKTLLYFAGQGSTRQLFARPLSELDAKPIRLAERWFEPFVSPDGRFVGFLDESDYILRKMTLSSGPPTAVTSVGTEILGATWGPDDTIVFAKRAPLGGLWRVSAAGGTATALTSPDQSKGELQDSWPEFLPDGQRILFTIRTGTGRSDTEIAAFDLKTQTRKRLLPGTNPKFVPPDYLLFVVEGTVNAVRFDPARLELRGDPVPVLEGVLTKSARAADFSLAADGTLAYITGSGSSIRRKLAWLNRSGGREAINAPPRAYVIPRISPDGSRAVIDIRDEESDLWSWDFARQTLTRLTTDPTFDGNPVFAPDGSRLFFASARGGINNIYSAGADGSGQAERVGEGSNPNPNTDTPSSITPDGSRLILRRDALNTGMDLMILSTTPPHSATPLLQTKFNERNGEVSPNGKWFAYDSNESGTYEVYVRPFPNADSNRWPISAGGGMQPVWSRDGRELIYSAPNNRLMGASISNTGPFAASAPRVIAEGPRFYGTLARSYDISPDGKRFLIIEESADSPAGATNIVVVLNWIEELKRLLPGR